MRQTFLFLLGALVFGCGGNSSGDIDGVGDSGTDGAMDAHSDAAGDAAEDGNVVDATPSDSSVDAAADTATDASEDTSADAADDGTDAADASEDATPLECGEVGHGSESEIAATPRDNPNLELLALTLRPERLTADANDYARLVANIAAIYEEEPAVDGITYRGSHNGKNIILGVDEETYGKMMDGSYVDWDCLNDHYELLGTSFLDFGSSFYVSMELEGIYNLSIVVADYETLAGVELADIDGIVGDGPSVCVAEDGDEWTYIFDEASGDCPAGCIYHHYYMFTTTPDGTVTPGGDWEPGSGSEPSWFGTCTP